MTENEAIRVLKTDSCYECSQGANSPIDCEYGACRVAEATRMAIQALEEVQQYRAIEKRLADMFGDELSLENYVDMLEETLEDSIAEQDNPHIVKTRIVTMENVASLEAYRAIGTVDECRVAVEKQRAKKPRLIGNAMICPSCPKVYSSDRVTCCINCGQKLDWE